MSRFWQACSRALMADSADDGNSYTVNGTTVDIRDNFGFNIGHEHAANGMFIEEGAVSAGGGAYLLVRSRYNNQNIAAYSPNYNPAFFYPTAAGDWGTGVVDIFRLMMNMYHWAPYPGDDLGVDGYENYEVGGHTSPQMLQQWDNEVY